MLVKYVEIEGDGKLGNLNNHLFHRGSFTQFARKYSKQNKTNSMVFTKSSKG